MTALRADRRDSVPDEWPSPGWGNDDLLALVVLGGLVASLFWPHIVGDATFVGDSDRLSHFLTWLKHLTEGMRTGYLPTWNEAMFGGYSSVSLPYAYPTPFALLTLLWPARELVYAAGLVSCLLLALAGWAAYAFIRESTGTVFTAFVGAALYQLAAAPILRVSQNDMTFMVFIVVPLAMLLLRTLPRGATASRFVLLAVSIAYLLTVSFLQEAAYAVMLLGLYACYRAFMTRKPRTVAVFTAAVICAVLFAFPRIYMVSEEYGLSTRHYASGTSRDFQAVYIEANTIFKTQLLRWFDDRIFGITAEDALRSNVGVNLHEGLLIYASAFAPLLALYALLRYIAGFMRLPKMQDRDVPFYAAFLAFAFFVVLTKAGYWVMYHLFLNIDFMHARIITVAALSHCALIAAGLTELSRGEESTRERKAALLLAGALVAALVLCAVELHAASVSGYTRHRLGSWGPPVFLARSAIWRIAASFCLFVALSGLIHLSQRQRSRRAWLGYVLGFLIVGQVYVYARDQIIGPAVRATPPTLPTHNRLLARGDEFKVPSARTLAAFHEKLRPDLYRTAIVCDRHKTIILCAPHITNFWRLRAIEGYVSAVPSRIAALPWGEAISLRSVSFTDPDRLPWPLLGLLNVKYSVSLNAPVMTNVVHLPDGGHREAAPADVFVRKNPWPVTPRVFFVRSVQGVRDLEAARAALFPDGRVNPAGFDVASLSHVEGFIGNRRFATDGTIRAVFRDQRIELELEPSTAERFLVLNERFHPRWHGFADRTELRLYPTNVFMRGLFVPPGVKHIVLEYQPFAGTVAALGCYVAAATLTVVGAWVIGRGARAT